MRLRPLVAPVNCSSRQARAHPFTRISHSVVSSAQMTILAPADSMICFNFAVTEPRSISGLQPPQYWIWSLTTVTRNFLAIQGRCHDEASSGANYQKKFSYFPLKLRFERLIAAKPGQREDVTAINSVVRSIQPDPNLKRLLITRPAMTHIQVAIPYVRGWNFDCGCSN